MKFSLLSALILVIVHRSAGTMSEYSPECSFQVAKSPFKPNEDNVITQQFRTKDNRHSYRVQAVFDGHGGPEVSEFLKKQFLFALRFTLSDAHALSSSADGGNGEISAAEQQAAIKSAVYSLDEYICKTGLGMNGDRLRGSTATFALQFKRRLIIGNIGDSRTLVLGADGQLKFATRDHKPRDPEENQHIRSKGGVVIKNRLYGTLAVSRAFGDCSLKLSGDFSSDTPYDPEGQLRVTPEFRVFEGVDEPLTVFSASDGVFDVTSNEKIAEHLFGDTSEMLKNACAAVGQYAKQQGSADDISAVISKTL
jgi:serine/threonine protein phosphatase PrpC